jgi:hypothetical protein
MTQNAYKLSNNAQPRQVETQGSCRCIDSCLQHHKRFKLILRVRNHLWKLVLQKPISFAQLFDKETSALNDITINCHPEIIHFAFVHCVIPTGFDFLLQFGYQCCVPSGT